MELYNSVNELHLELKEEINTIMSMAISLADRYERILNQSSDAIEKINITLQSSQFRSEEEEISFFKTHLPNLYATYIKYVALYQIELQKPISIKKVLERFYKKELRKVEGYNQQQSELLRYLRSGRTHLDQLYFLRGKSITDHSIDSYLPAINKQCCTIYTLRVATLQANEAIKDHLYQAINDVKHNFEVVNKLAETSTLTQLRKLIWTDSKTNLIELAYALQSAGCFNEGKAQLTQIIAYMEHIFSVNLGNTTRIFQDILARKTGYTKFLEQLKDRLLARIEKIEDKNVRA